MTSRTDPEEAVSAGGMTGRHPSRRFRLPSCGVVPGAALAVVALTLLAAVPALAGATLAVAVSAVILPKSNCRFSTGAAALAFGDLDPANPVDVTVSVPIGFRCNGGPPMVLFLVADDDGMNDIVPGEHRMLRAGLPEAHLPYAFSVTPASATVPRNTPQTLTVTGTVLGADYQAAAAGDYSDAVVVSINP